jgi:hypothetical protein
LFVAAPSFEENHSFVDGVFSVRLVFYQAIVFHHIIQRTSFVQLIETILSRPFSSAVAVQM